MWWLATGGYVIAGMFTFRTAFLAFRDEIQRDNEGVPWDKIHEREKYGTVAFPILIAMLWPLVLIGYIVYFAMFPRGVKTKFDQEQEAKKRTEEAEEELRKARKLMDEMGIKHGYR